MLESIERDLAEIGNEIEKEIEKVISKKGIPNLHNAIWYHLDSGGKRLRPALAVATCKVFGGDVKKVIPFAAGCELLHNWLLIHDDIEDGDVIRRDKPALWKKYGLAHGINAGDYMSEKVYELILKSEVDEKTLIRLLKETIKTCALTAEGQTHDMNLRENNNPSEEEYMNSVKRKTAYYLTMPIVGGAIIAGAPDNIINKIKEFGMKIGPAFQIVDDLLDLTKGKGRKEIGSDIKEGKRSIMVVHCSSKCNSEEKTKLFEILNKPRRKTSDKDVLWVKGLFEKYGSMTYAREMADKLVMEAKEIVSGFPDEARELLNRFAEYMIKRKR